MCIFVLIGMAVHTVEEQKFNKNNEGRGVVKK